MKPAHRYFLARRPRSLAAAGLLAAALFAASALPADPTATAASATAASAPAPSATAPSATAPSAPAPAAAPEAALARSALLAVEATETKGSLVLRIRRTADQKPVEGPGVSVTVDGKNEPVTAQSDGSYVIAARNLNEGEHVLDITVPHDGIREILTGKWVVKGGQSATGLLGDHKQMAWWILNVAVVLIAAIALSRRKS